MEKLAAMLAEYMCRHNEDSEISYDIYHYCFLLLLEMAAGSITGVVIAVYMGVPAEAAVFLGVFVLLRSYAGGLHLETFSACYFASTGILTGAFWLIRHGKANIYVSFPLILIFGGVLMVSKGCSSKNRPVSREESAYFKRKLYGILAVTGCLYLAFILTGYIRCSLAVSLAVTISGLLAVLGKIKNGKTK